jgi:hypothetical protein
MTDIDLISRIKNEGDNRSLVELVARHEPLYHRMANRYMNFESIRQFNFNGEKYHFFYKLAKDFDPTRGMKFSSFVAERTRFLCKAIFSAAKLTREVPLEDIYIAPVSATEDITSDRLRSIYIRTLLIKDPRARRIILDRYFNSQGRVRPFAQIAAKLGLSTRGVKSIHDRYIEIIKQGYIQYV